ncbi:MAG: hypothetical protein EOP09_02820 [Proteobacteria bacterium]|nr:MAG: hypothetical protein EOP09_02820 [Pseudomonadota bacterium]
MNSSNVLKNLRSAATAEIQAIAIYEAECFWMRRSPHFEFLTSIYLEEIEHGQFISQFINVSAVEIWIQQFIGWILGTLLTLLPWKLLCRVQSWAESQAADIYSKALISVEAHPEWQRNSTLIAGLKHAIESELGHSALFAARYAQLNP